MRRSPSEPGSIGLPIDGAELRVVDGRRDDVAQGDAGEVQIRGTNVMKGYWGRVDATAAAIDAGG